MSESPLGEADSTSLSDTKKERFECPECNDTFIDYPSNNPKFCSRECYASYRRGNFTGEDHWQYKEKVGVECAQCGDTYEVNPSESERTTYCSWDCQRESQTERYAGEGNPFYKGSVVLECEYCGEEYEKKPSMAEQSRFCSMECKGDWQSENNRGKDSPRYKPSAHVTRECAYCDSEFDVPTADIENGRENTGKYCSAECMDKWRSENWVGENNPLYKGGDEYYGENWYKVRDKVMHLYENACAICNRGKEELGREPDVHHIIPIRNFDSPEDANRIENLVPLCPKHHSKLEGWNVVPPNIRPDSA